MAQQELLNTLKNMGLDDKEAELYLASVSLGDANMTELAKKAGVKRTSAYVVFQSLERKGLMGSFKMRRGLHFTATRPELLLQKTKQMSDQLATVLPELRALERKAEHHPRIYYYEGKNGYFTAAEDSLRAPNTTIRHMGSIQDLHKIIGQDYDLNVYVPNRIKQHIFIKALYYSEHITPEIKSRSDADELREIRFLPTKYLEKTSTLIYGDRVAIFSTKKELITVIIESQDIADSEQKRFDLIWDLVGKNTKVK